MSTKEYVYKNHLKELQESGFEMANGEPDIRNWKVISNQNQEIGRIVELLFHEVSRRVRYVVVDLNGKPLNLVSRNVIIPIGLAELNKVEKVVLFPGLNIGHIASLPSYERGKITIETERSIRSVFAPTNGIDYRDEDFHDSDEYDDRKDINVDKVFRPSREVVQKIYLKDELKENIERVKESVKKMESDVEKLG